MVLDAIRQGRLAAAPDIIDMLFSANDILTDLVESTRAQVDLPSNYEGESRTALARFMRNGAERGMPKDRTADGKACISVAAPVFGGSI